MRESESEKTDGLRQVAAAAVASMAGLAVDGAAGTFVGAVSQPLLEPLIARVWGEVGLDVRRRATAVTQIALASFPGDEADFEAKLGTSEQSRLLAATALDAGGRTTWPPKLRALGLALAQGITSDDARVDDWQLLMGALAALDVPHARVLGLLLTRKWQSVPDPASPRHWLWTASDLSQHEQPPHRYPRWAAWQIGSALPNLAGIVPTLLGTLQSHGLAVPEYDISEIIDNLVTEHNDGTFEINTTTGPSEPAVAWVGTPLGLRLHELLVAAGGDADLSM